MKNLFFVSLLVSLSIHAQNDLGRGLVKVNFNEHTVLQFFEDTTDFLPLRTLVFFDDTTIFSWNIVDLEEAQNTWLEPEVLWLDYAPLTFRCTNYSSNWYEVMVNNTTGTVLWLKKTDVAEFENWETFLREMFNVERNTTDMQRIHQSPDENSTVFVYVGEECFKVISMKGDWIQIAPQEFCEGDFLDAKHKSGWIKWRKGNQLLIGYFITS